MQRVIEFEKRARTVGCLTMQYTEVGEFGELFRDHLTNFLLSLDAMPPPPRSRTVRTDQDVESRRSARRQPEPVLADLEDRAKVWMRGEPLLWPDFSGSAALADEVGDLGAPTGLSEVATELMLMLSIQQGTRWWVWFRRAESMPEVPRILVLALEMMRRPWMRVAVRGAYLIQCLDPDALRMLSTRIADDAMYLQERELLEAARSGTVREWVRERMREADEVEFGKLASVSRELARASSFLGCDANPGSRDATL